MAGLSGNSCNIITILPLGLECDSINASTPTSTNGLIALYITGGTSPYNVSWNNGSQTTLLTNLSPGEYTATVTDYYGDFTATTTCNVGYDSFYLDQFENCENSGNTVYYLANLFNTLSGGSIYNLTTQLGCWIYSGQTLYTGQTYINNNVITSAGPFSGCSECLPPPTPAPVYPSNLCLQFTQNSTITQTNYSSGDTINGYPSWTSVTETMYYDSGTTQWKVSGWTGGGNLYFQTPATPPLGYWTLVGAPSFGSSVYVSSGVCQAPPLTMTVAKTNPSCSGVYNGSITITPNGGTSPYIYSLDGINFQASNTFIGLNPGPYTVYVSDNNSTIISQSVLLSPQQSPQNYIVSLNLSPGQTINVNDTSTKTSTWSLTVSPYPLPPGTSINMNLVFNVNTTAYTINSPSVTYTNTITKTQTGSFTISSGTTGTTVGTTTPSPICPTSVINTSAYTVTHNVQFSGAGTIGGTIVQYINTPCVYDPGCELFANIKDTISVQNITISPNICKSVNSFVLPQQVTLQKTGLNCHKE